MPHAVCNARKVVIPDVLVQKPKLFDEAIAACSRIAEAAERDPQGNYAVDCRVNSMARPLMIFALANDDRARDATIALHQFEKWGLPHQSLGIFEDQEEANRKVLARFSDVVEKQFASLAGNRDRIGGYLRGIISV